MRRVALAALLVVGCGAPASPASSPEVWQTCSDGRRVERFSNACPPAPAAPLVTEPAAPAPAPAPARVAPALPPPKPTTVSLARTGDAELDAALRAGDEAFEAGDLAKAEASYGAAKTLRPKRVAGAVGLARVRVARAAPNLGYASAEKNKDVTAAARELAAAAKAEPAFGPALLEQGRALLLLGDAPGAEAALVKAQAALPEEAEAHSALGVALLAGGKSEQAAVALTKARDLDVGSAARHGNLGTVLFMRSRVPEAIKEYEMQVQLAPDDARAHSDLGTALLASQEMVRAEAELRRAIALDPQRATFRSNLGYALQLQGKVREAVVEYREALRLDAKLVSAWVNLATALSRDPATRAEARRALDSAKKLDPSDPRVKANLEELDALEKGAPAPPR